MKEVSLHDSLKPIDVESTGMIADIYYNEAKMFAWRDSCAKQA